MKKSAGIIILNIILFYSQNINANNDFPLEFKFSNTTSVQHFSSYHDNEARTKHETVLDEPAFVFNEKFGSFLRTKNRSGNVANLGCMSVPQTFFFNINIVLSHDENFATIGGCEFIGGFGDYKNPFASVGFGNYKSKDRILGSDSEYRHSFILNLGHRNDFHFHLNIMLPDDDYGFNEEANRFYLNADIALGYKKIFPLFLRFNGYGAMSQSAIDNDNVRYTYNHVIHMTHIQYYGEHFDFSIGYTQAIEEYEKEKFDYKDGKYKSVDFDEISEKKYKGGGFTFNKRFWDSAVEMFGEAHLMFDGEKNHKTITKFGLSLFF